ncbi:MAG: DNA-binding transcriptional LysR family regulator [Sneathiella sp.]|jgi:DNA-binding transcriptional LysR family regulator
MNDMDWNLVRSFLSVAETGTLTHSADALKISQPTLGRHINELESQLGVSLFVRGRSGMRLTEAGYTLVEDARQMAEGANAFMLKAAGKSESLKGSVRITASEVVATYILPPILADLKCLEPEIELEIVASNKVDNLLSRDADIALRMVQPTQNDVIVRKITEISIGCFAARSYLDHWGVPKNAEDLLTHQLVGYDRNDLILRQMSSMGYSAARSDFAIRTDDQVVNWELVKAGAGIGFGGVFLASQSPNLVRLLPDLALPELPMWLASHQELRTNMRIRRVSDFLYEALKALPF